MPSKSLKQHRLMQAVAHSEKFAKKVGIPTSVGKDFENADKAEGKFQKEEIELDERYSNADHTAAHNAFMNLDDDHPAKQAYLGASEEEQRKLRGHHIYVAKNPDANTDKRKTKFTNHVNRLLGYNSHYLTQSGKSRRYAMKESIQQFIQQVAAKDMESAATTFQEILGAKVASRLEDMKVDVANQYFNGANESVELDEAFTRQHFKKMAEVIKNIPDAKTRQEMADSHAKVFHADNARFNHDMWHKACGTEYKG